MFFGKLRLATDMVKCCLPLEKREDHRQLNTLKITQPYTAFGKTATPQKT